MNKTKYTIYWTFCGQPESMVVYDMGQALGQTEQIRKTPGYSAVVMAAENPDQVGEMGVDTIKDGKLPDGQDYVYKTGRDRGRDPR